MFIVTTFILIQETLVQRHHGKMTLVTGMAFILVKDTLVQMHQGG